MLEISLNLTIITVFCFILSLMSLLFMAGAEKNNIIYLIFFIVLFLISLHLFTRQKEVTVESYKKVKTMLKTSNEVDSLIIEALADNKITIYEYFYIKKEFKKELKKESSEIERTINEIKNEVIKK